MVVRDPEGGRSSGRGSVSWTATLGLVVHAAADGIALGAAATTNQTDVEMIVFLAIMLHKVSTENRITAMHNIVRATVWCTLTHV